MRVLQAGTLLEPGCQEEVSIRVASIIGVERVREQITQMREVDERAKGEAEGVTSVLIDFYLWDLAKKIEAGDEKIEGIETTKIVPPHRTRSIWY